MKAEKKWNGKIIILVFVLSFWFVMCSGCGLREKAYYSHRENYVTITGTVNHIKYNEDKSVLYLGMSDMNPELDDNAFKIEGENVLVVQKNGIDDKLKLGAQIEVISAPHYFGDGYIFPIIGMCVKGEVLLEIEIGLNNFLAFLGE